QVMVRREGVAAPQNDELRVAERLRIHPDAVVAERIAGADSAGDRADRHQMLRGPEHVPDPAPGAIDTLEETHAARAEVGPDRLGAEFPGDAGESLGDLI